jgi:hypothetical protein
MDVLSIVSVINIFGFIFMMDYCVRKRIKITLPLIFFWVLILAIVTIPLSIGLAILYGQQLTASAMEALFTNLVGLTVAFFIMDVVMYFIAKFLYQKIPTISVFLGHDKLSMEENEKKHMSKITLYTHEKPGSQEFEAIKTDAEKMMKEHTSLDTLQVEKGTENIVGRRKHKNRK